MVKIKFRGVELDVTDQCFTSLTEDIVDDCGFRCYLENCECEGSNIMVCDEYALESCLMKCREGD